MEDNSLEAFREVNLSDGKCNVSLYVCAEEEKKIDEDPEYASKLFKAALEGKLPSASDDTDADPVFTSDNVTQDGEQNKNKMTQIADWNVTATWILINVIRKNTKLIAPHGNKKIVFTKALTNLAEAGYTFSLQCIELKFNSLMTTYRGLKKSLQNGKGRAKWEYYEAIDSMMNEVENLRLQKENGEVDNSNKSDPEIEDISSLLEVGITEENTKANMQEKSKVSKGPKISKEQEVANKTDPPKKRARISSPIPPNKRQKLISNDKPVKKVTVKEEPITEETTMKNVQHVVCGDEGFNHTGTLLFIDLIKKHIDLLKKKKSAEMFTRISAEMAKEGYSYTVPKLRKKWYNLLISYRRILERANETGDLVCHWPYYEEIDSIIVDTKALAQNARGIVNHASSGASTSAATRGKRLSAKTRLLLDDDEEEEEEGDEDVTQRRRRRNKRTSVLNLLRLREGSGYASDLEEDYFQRNLLEDWEQRELRREERDKVKLDILKKIADSVEEMTRKQDEIIDLLNGLN